MGAAATGTCTCVNGMDCEQHTSRQRAQQPGRAGASRWSGKYVQRKKRHQGRHAAVQCDVHAVAERGVVAVASQVPLGTVHQRREGPVALV